MSTNANITNITNTSNMDTMTRSESVNTVITDNNALKQEIEELKTMMKLMLATIANGSAVAEATAAEANAVEADAIKAVVEADAIKAVVEADAIKAVVEAAEIKAAVEAEAKAAEVKADAIKAAVEAEAKVAEIKAAVEAEAKAAEVKAKELATFINKILQNDIYVNGEITQIKPYATNVKVLNKKGSVTFINEIYGANVNFIDGTGGLQIPFDQITLTIKESPEWIAHLKKEKDASDALERERLERERIERERTEARRFVHNVPILVGGPPMFIGGNRSLGFLTVHSHSHPFGRVTYTF